MKIAVSADLHLTTRPKNPERYNALQNVLEQMRDLRINTLILAGDTFDESGRNYAEFEALCQQTQFQEIQFLIIPGNHDGALSSRSITAGNVEVITEAGLKQFDAGGMKIFFVPYSANRTMGEFIAENIADLPPNRWILIAHGDCTEGMDEPNPLEPGVYMPLTRIDIESYKPCLAILGHIHKPVSNAPIHYAGSPCGLDIRETGRRRFLVLDTETGSIESIPVDSDFIYFNEALVVLPGSNELDFVEQQIQEKIAGWNLTEDENDKVRIQIKVTGYTTNKKLLQEKIKTGLKDFQYYKEMEPDLSEVFIADDANLDEIMKRVSAKIADLLPGFRIPPHKIDILLQALHVIYGD